METWAGNELLEGAINMLRLPENEYMGRVKLTEEERARAFEQMFETNFEDYRLENLVYAAYALQVRCAHCSSGRRDASYCADCEKQTALTLLEDVLQGIYKAETGEDLPLFNIPKCICRPARALEGLKALNDRVVHLQLKVMHAVDCALESICNQCRDHHPDRTANGECKRCEFGKATKAMELEGGMEGPVSTGRPLGELIGEDLSEL